MSIDSINLYLKPKAFASLLGLQYRQAARILAEISAAGYDLPTDGHGARLIHPKLASAVKANRERQGGVLNLRFDRSLDKYLRKGRAAEPEPLEVLIEVAAEVAIVREAAVALEEGARLGLGNAWRPPLWSALGLPNPSAL